LNTNKKL